MKVQMKSIVEWLLAVILLLATCAISWLIGDVHGIHYQRDMVKLPSSNGVANYFDLTGESEMTINPLCENQSVAVTLLMRKGSVECWIENENGEAVTETMSFDQDGSFIFGVPSDGTYMMIFRGDHTSFNVAMLTYDRE